MSLNASLRVLVPLIASPNALPIPDLKSVWKVSINWPVSLAKSALL